jgi:pimeloyl-ACP methyl ester carboxylesterase
MLPETRYAKSGSTHIAYQVLGEGPEDIVLVPGWISNVDVFWDEPVAARFLQSLAEVGRLILFDKRGTGLSDPIVGVATLEERMDDVRAVMDAVGSEQATLFGYSEGGPMSALFAATYPKRTRALVLHGSYACRRALPGYEIGLDKEQGEAMLKRIEGAWGTAFDIEQRIPTMASNRRFCEWWARFMRAGASPSTAVALQKMNLEIDVRPILSAITAPALITHARGDRIVPLEAGRHLARAIPDAKFVEFEADDHTPFGDAGDRIVAELSEFLTGQERLASDDRTLCTIMFTDIVGSTELAQLAGDKEWTDTLFAHDQRTRQVLTVYRGREVNTTGDGFVAVFDGPARAVRCGKAICEAMRAIGLDLRVGIHTGECVLRGNDVSGVAVHIAARIGALADRGQVLVSQTVRDLVAGSGIEFAELGARQLRGVEGEWRICEAL